MIKEVHDMIEMEEDGIDAKFKQIFEYVQHGKCLNLFCNECGAQISFIL